MRKPGDYWTYKIGYIPYNQEVSVGLCYRQDDKLWEQICDKALRDCLETKDSKILESLEETKNLSEKIGIQWLAA